MVRKRKNRSRSLSKNKKVNPDSDPSTETMSEENDPISESSMWPADAGSQSAAPLDPRVLTAIDNNTELLEQIQSQLTKMCEGMAAHVGETDLVHCLERPEEAPTSEEVLALRKHASELKSQVSELKSQVIELERQNDELTAQATSASIQAAVASTEATHETLSWAERKQLILQQMEAETFDAEEFVESLGDEIVTQSSDSDDPVEYVNRLNDELARREEEIRELQHLLEQQSETRDAGVSIGAAGIAELLDSDELVREERARLQVLQDEWEEKFRQAEIEASLERAKLSRERRELAAKQSELEAELERARLQTQRETEKDAPRKWLSQLGLAGS